MWEFERLLPVGSVRESVVLFPDLTRDHIFALGNHPTTNNESRANRRIIEHP